jgi:hypothetical protein
VRLHLQGMGLLGSLTAWRLRRAGVEFTWDDVEADVNAWKASTGTCYPSGGLADSRCHARWLTWAADGSYPDGTVEVCRYWVDDAHKTLPHGLSADVEDEYGGVKLVGRSVHVNAQELVAATRAEFADRRRSRPPGSRLIVSHGFSDRLARYLWGWTRLVKLWFPDGLARHGRPSFYLRKNRFQFAYCYPQPGTDWWYAGSNLISQTVARELDPVPKYAAWKGRFHELAGGAVRVTDEGEYIQGWRPAKAGGLSADEGYRADAGGLLEVRSDGTVYFPVLASNGFRHFPDVWDELAAVLGINEKPPADRGRVLSRR